MQNDRNNMVTRGIQPKEAPLQPERAHRQRQVIRRRWREPQAAEALGRLNDCVVCQEVVVVPEPLAMVNGRVNPKAGQKNDSCFPEHCHPLGRYEGLGHP